MEPGQGRLPEGRSGLFRLWEQAVPLNRAVEMFAGGDDSRQLRDAVERTVDGLRRDPRSPLIDRKLATDRLQAIGQAWERQARMLDAARQRLLARLGAGDLVAIGFARQGGAARRLTALETDVWLLRPAVYWEAESARLDAVTYEDLRILALRRGIPAAGVPDRSR